MDKKRISKLESFFAASVGKKVWAGVDVHKRSYSVALLREDGSTVERKTVADNLQLIEQISNKGMLLQSVTFEAGPTGFSLARCCIQKGIPAIVTAPSRIVRPVSPMAKTDRLDCRKLAVLTAKDMVKSIAIPTEDEEALRALERRRHQLADDRREVKQRIRSFLLFHGIEEPCVLEHWSNSGIEQLEKVSLHPILKEVLKDMVDDLRQVIIRISEIEKLLIEHTTKIHQHRQVCLQSVPGVGPLIASSFLAELFRPDRFKRGEEVTSYLGLAPTVRQSGERSPRGRLHPTGHGKLRALLIEAAWIWKSRDKGVQEYYTRILSHTGLAQKAITAVARKLALVLWRLACELRLYRSS